MALLHSNNVVFYHPCDDLVEKTKLKEWEHPDVYGFADVVILSGIKKPSSAGSTVTLQYPSGSYMPPSDMTSMTTCFWASGTIDSVGYLYIGWMSGTSPSFGAGHIGVNFQSASLSGALVQVLTSNINGSPSSVQLSGGYIGRQLTNREFFVVHTEFADGRVQGYLSISGQPFIDIGNQALNPPKDNPQYGGLVGLILLPWPNTATGRRLAVDEVVLWKNTQKFTDSQLSNLYLLGASANKSMDQYTEEYTLKASGLTDLFISGPSAYSGSVDLYSSGYAPALSGQVPLYGYGAGPASGDLLLYTIGVAPTILSGELSLYIIAPVATISGFIPSYIHGVMTHTAPMFLRTEDSLYSGCLDLFTYGSASGTTLYSYTSNIPLYLFNDSATPSKSLGGTMFMGVSSGEVSYSHSGPLFMGVSEHEYPYLTETRDLFISGPFISSGFVSSFIKGSGLPGSDGFTPFGSVGSFFMRVNSGLEENIPLFCLGGGPILSSGSLNSYVYGITGLPSGTIELFGCGSENTSGYMKSYVYGVTGIPSGHIEMVVLGPLIGNPSDRRALYVHGY